MTEAYLEDVLTLFAGKRPDVMTDGQGRFPNVVNYADVRESSSLGELDEFVRRRWAKRVVEDGGPRTWVKRLEGFGARNVLELADELEQMWGLRHHVIHSAGVISR